MHIRPLSLVVPIRALKGKTIKGTETVLGVACILEILPKCGPLCAEAPQHFPVGKCPEFNHLPQLYQVTIFKQSTLVNAFDNKELNETM